MSSRSAPIVPALLVRGALEAAARMVMAVRLARRIPAPFVAVGLLVALTVLLPATSETPRGPRALAEGEMVTVSTVAAAADAIVAQVLLPPRARLLGTRAPDALADVLRPEGAHAPAPALTPPSAPLTGTPLPPALLDVLARPVLAVKIDNARAARPQSGLDRADVVVTELVEGGLTRFLALYQSADAGVVGPVRSGRDLDALLLPAFHPLLAMSGAAGPTQAVLDAAGLPSFSEHRDPGAFSRSPARRAPHNFYADTAALRAFAPPLPSAAPTWPRSVEIPPGGLPTAQLALRHSEHATAGWTWDVLRGRWLRGQDGAAHLTDLDAPLGADNVVLLRAAMVTGGGVDVTGAATVDALLLGAGDAVLLRDGQSWPLRWRKTAPAAQLEWLTLEGAAFPLRPGTTWIELHDVTQPYTVVPR